MMYMRGCSVHYHETVDLTDSVDSKLIDPPKATLRDNQEGINELAASIREKGLIQPILIRPMGDRFEVVAGARRLEACRQLRWGRIPCIIRQLSDRSAYEISLTENIQRKTMNAIEEARAFKVYIEENGWGSESQLARKIGKSQEYISQRLLLLSLPASVQKNIIRHRINTSVGQEIAGVEDRKAQEILSEEAMRRHMTVGMVRETAKSLKQGDDIKSALKYVDEKRRYQKEKIKVLKRSDRSFQINDLSEPDFALGLERSLDAQGVSRDTSVRSIEKTILVLKLALSRLAMIIDEMPEDSDVKDMLLEKRLVIHNMIDSLIKSKIGLGGLVAAQVSDSHERR